MRLTRVQSVQPVSDSSLPARNTPTVLHTRCCLLAINNIAYTCEQLLLPCITRPIFFVPRFSELVGVALPLALPNVPRVWKLVATLAEQAHVIHCAGSKMLPRRPCSTATRGHARHGLLERTCIVMPLRLLVQAAIEIE